jgi:hypothetical protein
MYLTKLLTSLVRMDLKCEYISIGGKKNEFICSSHNEYIQFSFRYCDLYIIRYIVFLPFVKK